MDIVFSLNSFKPILYWKLTFIKFASF